MIIRDIWSYFACYTWTKNSSSRVMRRYWIALKKISYSLAVLSWFWRILHWHASSRRYYKIYVIIEHTEVNYNSLDTRGISSTCKYNKTSSNKIVSLLSTWARISYVYSFISRVHSDCHDRGFPVEEFNLNYSSCIHFLTDEYVLKRNVPHARFFT